MTEKQWIAASNQLFILSLAVGASLFLIEPLPFWGLTLVLSILSTSTAYNGSLSERRIKPLTSTLKAITSMLLWIAVFYKFEEATLNFGIATAISLVIFTLICLVTPKPR